MAFRKSSRASQISRQAVPDHHRVEMNYYFTLPAFAFTGFIIGTGCWLGWQLLRQNGRVLLRLDELEKRLDDLEFDEPGSSRGDEAPASPPQPSTLDAHSNNQGPVTSAATTNGDNRSTRFSNRSLTRSKIK